MLLIYKQASTVARWSVAVPRDRWRVLPGRTFDVLTLDAL